MFRLARRFSTQILRQRKYTPDHEWVSVQGKIATFGITDYAQKALGDVVYIELPSLNDAVKKQDQVGAVESVKAASDIYSPLSGKIVEVNTSLEGEPSLVNSSPYEQGWIAKIELENEGELGELMDEDAYTKHTVE